MGAFFLFYLPLYDFLLVRGSCLLQRYAVFEDGEFDIAVYFGCGALLAGGDIYDVGDEALE